MQFNYFIVFAILFGSKTCLSQSSSERVNLRLCTQSRSVSVEVLAGVGDDLSCQCQANRLGDPSIRNDYVHRPGIGSHKLHINAKSWNEARRICRVENAHLAIINSKAKETILVNMLKNAMPTIKDGANTEQAFLGIHDFFNEGEWLTIFGEPLNTTGYVE